jgi:hypothetical protein
VIELLCGAEHGTALGYASEAGKTVPVLQDNEAERGQHRKLVAPIQDAALRYFDAWLAALLEEGDDVISAELCAAVGLRAICRPTLDEATLLGGLKHVQDFAGHMKSITGMSEWDLGRISPPAGRDHSHVAPRLPGAQDS